MLLGHLLFYGPFLVGLIGSALSEDFALSVMSEGNLRGMEAAYTDAPARRASENAQMTGFYVYNNVGIAFRCFATGALAGLGSVFFLVFNGLMIGTTFGHLGRTGQGWNLLEFVSGHAAWELTAIAVSGAAGLRLGWALVAPGRRSRVDSARHAGPELFALVMGAALMLGIAALVEGLWSGTSFGAYTRPLKLVFGGLQIGLVAAWMGFSGREGDSP